LVTAAQWKYTYTKRTELGRGSFAIVYAGTRKKNNISDPIAVKVCTSETDAQKRVIAVEIGIFKEIGTHPNVVRLHTTFVQENQAHMCFERCDEDLDDYVRARPSPMDESEIRVAGRQIASAVEYLHARGIMHRDIKPKNILLCATSDAGARPFGRIAKISDFGLASRCAATAAAATAAAAADVSQTWCGSPLFMSPEMLYRSQYDKEVDIYALGVILYYMRTRSTPVRGKTIEELRAKLPTCKLVWPNGTSPGLREVCAAALCHDPKKRLKHISQHPYFTSAEPPDVADEYVIVESFDNADNKTVAQLSLLAAAATRTVNESDRLALAWATRKMSSSAAPPLSPSHPRTARRLIDADHYARCSTAAAARGDSETARLMMVLALAGDELVPASECTSSSSTTSSASVVAESNYLGAQTETSAPLEIVEKRGAAKYCYNCGAAFRSGVAKQCVCGHMRFDHMSI
jgi:serine/threonine protein kinase